MSENFEGKPNFMGSFESEEGGTKPDNEETKSNGEEEQGSETFADVAKEMAKEQVAERIAKIEQSGGVSFIRSGDQLQRPDGKELSPEKLQKIVEGQFPPLVVERVGSAKTLEDLMDIVLGPEEYFCMDGLVRGKLDVKTTMLKAMELGSISAAEKELEILPPLIKDRTLQLLHEEEISGNLDALKHSKRLDSMWNRS